MDHGCALTDTVIWGCLEIDFLDILGYIGVGVVNSGIMLLLCMLLSKRHQVLFYGENVIKRQGDGYRVVKPDIGTEDDSNIDGEEKLAKKKEDVNDGDWVMSFNLMKSRSRADWQKAYFFSIGEVCVCASLLMVFRTPFSLFKSIGLGVMAGIGLILLMLGVGKIVSKKTSGSESARKTQYLVFTLVTCAMAGAIITYLLVSLGSALKVVFENLSVFIEE